MASGLGFHIALACGLLPGIWPGFASAQEVAGLQAAMQESLAQQLDSDIFQTREQECKTSSQEARTLYAERLNKKLEEYQQLRKNEPRVPDCSEFGSAQQPVAGSQSGN